MPQKLTVNDYTFLFVPLRNGAYKWKGKRGTINRKTSEEFTELTKLVGEPGKDNVFEVLFGIANIEIVKTGENILVYEVFKDLRDEEIEND